jgi:peptidyl-prolyl cis-trans isomerase A (cyclophilin A)
MRSVTSWGCGRFLVVVGLLTLVGATGCTTQQPSPSTPSPAATASPTPEPTSAATPTSSAAPKAQPGPSASRHPALLDPSRAATKAPATFRVRFDTTKGSFTVAVTRAWAPLGADRFYNLVKAGFYDEAGFFRVVRGFVVQFGLNADPQVNQAWERARIADDPVRESNRRGRLTFATAGPGTRTTQLFINTADNAGLDGQGFSPFGEVVEGLSVVDTLYEGYGDGPNQELITNQGNVYLKAQFPRLDFIRTARVL